MTVHFLHHLLACLPQRPLLLLGDRASLHKEEAKVFVGQHPRLQALYCPVGCPDWNPQEHVMKLTRQAVSHNHTCPTVGQLRQAFHHHLETPVS